MEYRELAEENGITKWRRVPALNTDSTFITDMADLVVEALDAPAISVAEAQSGNDMVSSIYLTSSLQYSHAHCPLESQMESALDRRLSTTNKSVKSASTAELLNGRVAMLIVLGIIGTELQTGQPILQLIQSQLHSMHLFV